MAIVIDAKIKSFSSVASLAKVVETLKESVKQIHILNAGLVTAAGNAIKLADAMRGMASGVRGATGATGGGSGNPNGNINARMARKWGSRGIGGFGPGSARGMGPLPGSPGSSGSSSPTMNPVQSAAHSAARSVLSGGGVGSILMSAGGQALKAVAMLFPEVVLAVALIVANILLVVAAFAALNAVIQAAREAMAAWTQAIVMGGGTGGEARSAASFAGMGIDVGAIGKGLMSGFGPVAAARAGVNPFGGPFGDNEYNRKGLRVLDSIRNSGNFNEARRRAEMANAPGAASAYLLSPQIYKAMRNQPEGAGSETNMKNFANFTESFALFMKSLQGAAATMVGPFLEQLSHGFLQMSKAINNIDPNFLKGFAVGLTAIGWVLKEVMYAIAGAIELWNQIVKKISEFIVWLLDLLHLDWGQHNKDDIGKNVKDGAREGTRQGVRDGLFGGGPRANSGPRSLNPAFQPGYGSANQGVL